MTDKEKIRAEIERWMGLCPECGHVLGKLCDFIDSIQIEPTICNAFDKIKIPQEPASKDLEQAAKEYADEQSVQAGIQSAFIAGTNWQKQQMKAYVINLNRRTLEYIYDVCKGVMPSKELFIKCVMSTIKED